MTASSAQTHAIVFRLSILCLIILGLLSSPHSPDAPIDISQADTSIMSSDIIPENGATVEDPKNVHDPVEIPETVETSIPPVTQLVQTQDKQPQEKHTPVLQSPMGDPLTLEEYTRCLAKQLDLDETLVLAILIQESHPTDPFRVGKKGSQGPLQVKPIALEAVGLSRDARQLPFLVYGGLLYLKSMLTRFPDLPTALAAYNMGPVRLKQRDYRPYISTQRYIKQILTRQEKIRSATFHRRPVLHYQLSAQELAVFPKQAEYPAECHLRQVAAKTSSQSSAA